MMRPHYARLFVHLVFCTKGRLPLIQPSIEPQLYAAIANKCRQHRCIPLAIGGVEDHIHILVRLPTTVSLALLIKELKGSSSHLVNHQRAPESFFQWQGTYGAFTVSEHHMPVVQRYVLRQKEHHQLNTLLPPLETTEEPMD